MSMLAEAPLAIEAVACDGEVRLGKLLPPLDDGSAIVIVPFMLE